MKLVRADGHRQQQWALNNPSTQAVACILSEYIDDNNPLFREVASVLRDLNGESHESLAQKLAKIRALYEGEGSEGSLAVPDYVTELLQAIHELYYQPRSVFYPNLRDQINSLRGAVLERLALELIRPRYEDNDECANSRRLVSERNKIVTIHEIDVAALSYERRELECYECKLKAVSLMNHNRLDLEYVHRIALEEDYQAQVGVISLDPSRLVEQRLKWLDAADCIQAYGVDVLNELQSSPFE
jgi:hypothetical protein